MGYVHYLLKHSSFGDFALLAFFVGLAALAAAGAGESGSFAWGAFWVIAAWLFVLWIGVWVMLVRRTRILRGMFHPEKYPEDAEYAERTGGRGW